MYKTFRQRLTALISNDIQIEQLEQLLGYIQMAVGKGLLFRKDYENQQCRFCMIFSENRSFSFDNERKVCF